MCELWQTRNRPMLEVTEPESDYYTNFYHHPDACSYTNSEALHVWITGNLTAEDAQLYAQGVVDGKSLRNMAQEVGVSKSELHRRIAKIKQIIVEHADEIRQLVVREDD